jgi:hypothetical protein
MNTKGCLAVLLVAISLASFGCVFSLGTPTGLSADQVTKVLACQDAIKLGSRDFNKAKLDNIEGCLDKVLKVKLQLENGVITQKTFDSKMNAVPDGIRNDCKNNKYASVTAASTVLFERILAACTPVESIVFSEYDPLLFGALSAYNLHSAYWLAAAVCGVQEAIADANMALAIPRMGLLLDDLGESFYNNISWNSSTIRVPAIPLDPRCISLSGGGG